ncbi:aspartate/glutamate racemase family protein [Microvirga antarctica]|uniref:aspartate/glutamate racemase family protein n=1 Tax=Microvirga antarctica TaxID=2819233 RepID=UPI001B312DF3|nr:aspartate/glutamate racemase family protein [Microvirga antarctica]
MHIACLHTAPSNATLFDDALSDLGRSDVVLRHAVRADLLDRAEQENGLTPAIAADTLAALRGLAQDADAVILTCSTLGPVVATDPPEHGARLLRADDALARRAVGAGGPLTVLCTVRSTLESTRTLFEKAAQDTDTVVAVALVPDAWALFRSGQPEAYGDAIAQAADRAFADGARNVALAQASMAPAAERCQGGRPLTSPMEALKSAIAAVETPKPVRKESR